MDRCPTSFLIILSDNYLAFSYQYYLSINNQDVGAFGMTIVSSFIYNLR